MMYYLIFGYADSILPIESAVFSLTPWLCLGALMVADRLITGSFHRRRSYVITTLLVSLVFGVIPMHGGYVESRAILEGAFEFSAAVTTSLFVLNYVVDLVNNEWR